MKYFRYTEEEHAWLKANIPGNSYKDIAEMFSERFRPITVERIHTYCTRHKIKTGRTGRFQKGNVPYTKGKKYTDFMCPKGIESFKKTWFKDGNTPPNQVPVGTERTHRGYVEIKVAMPNVWKRKHRVLWEQAYGPIPDGYYVRFKDGDHLNFELDNLMLVDEDTHVAMSRLHLQTPPPELFETAVLIGKLDAETWKKRKGINK